MSEHIERSLRQLPDPVPPPTLAPVVMARIAREANRERGAAGVGAANRREPLFWLWMAAGFAVVLGVTVYGWRGGMPVPVLPSLRFGSSLALMPAEGPATLFVAIGLLLYLAGLFAPLRR